MKQASLNASLSMLCKFLEDNFGLYFPDEKLNELEHGINELASFYHYQDLRDCIAWITHSDFPESEKEKIASYFTIGESYFFKRKSKF